MLIYPVIFDKYAGGQWFIRHTSPIPFFFVSASIMLNLHPIIAGWSSPVAREAHNLEVTGSNPVPAT